jgi:hypothetical protein
MISLSGLVLEVPYLYCTFSFMYGVAKENVELFIIKHIYIVEHFSIFSSFLNEIERFLCHWTHKLKSDK